ncbi:hypothetical protein ACIGEP_01970 [Microbacterium sp. NPDC077663]|uniref:hypothetical protein n=1 Tax=Microbacterium sp. NPDC077663 TaxID=3364189 RepID=UPI0037CBFC6C
MRRRGNIGRHRVIAAGAAAALTALLATGCAGPIAAAPSPGPTSAPTASAGETPSPEATDAAARGISSTCDEMLADSALSEATGSAGATEPDGLWSTAAEVAGGLVCGFDSDALSGTIVALPADRAESLVAGAEAECAPSYDAIECIGTGAAAGMVVAVSFLAAEQTPAETDTVVRLRDAALDAVRAADRTPLAEPAAAPPSCTDLAEIVDPSAVLRADEVFPEPIMEGDFPFDRRTVEAADLLRACDWSELTDSRELQVVIVPGAAGTWEEVSDRFGGTTGAIDGADAAEVQEDNRARLLVRGADALILVEGRFGDPERGVSADDLRFVAEKLLALS